MTKATYDITSRFVHTVDANSGYAYEVLARIDPTRSIADHLSALGLDDHAIWAESPPALGLVGWDGGRELAFSMVWRFDGNGRHATLTWRLTVDQDAAGRAVLGLTLSARGSDDEARRRILASWTLVEEFARGHARRLARTVEDYAHENDYEVAAGAPRLRAVV